LWSRKNQAALQAARQRYSEGATNFLDVTATQAQLLQSENDLSDSDTQIATYLVNLYRALGGGWQVADVAFGGDDMARKPKGAGRQLNALAGRLPSERPDNVVVRLLSFSFGGRAGGRARVACCLSLLGKPG